jgi:serine/threonine protein kinase
MDGGDWELGKKLGEGSYGKVFAATGPSGEPGAVKFIRKQRGAKRELLFEDELRNCRNVVPILDTGETDREYTIAMPRAEASLRDVLANGPLTLDQVRQVLEDLTDALIDLAANKVVHRDLKPENVLLLGSTWSIADFGISRYTEAATVASTHKYSYTPQYAAPEQWRFERATSATDMYALGVIAFELVSGERPFLGSTDELREGHLHGTVPPSGAPKKLAWLIEECLTKAPESRPSATEFRRRLDLSMREQNSTGLRALQDANQAFAQMRASLALAESKARTEDERRDAVAEAGRNEFTRLSSEFLEILRDNAPGITVKKGPRGAWTATLDKAELRLDEPKESGQSWRGPFEVILSSHLRLSCREPKSGYFGRSHSLWYSDAKTAREYGWFETAFIDNVWAGDQPSVRPYHREPDSQSGTSLSMGDGPLQHAWPFTRVDPYDIDEFADRWAKWFAEASMGTLWPPSMLPERGASGHRTDGVH